MKQDVLTVIQEVYHNFNDAFVEEVLVGPRFSPAPKVLITGKSLFVQCDHLIDHGVR